ncbi:MAG: CMP/dCMP deaminase zinc-binding [Candidatus Fermentimicrarchaeum limneticum]|uniref:CMP/dCMP deaminase zinc-binding n=1 Tax=Fermentimicrarchaeum limneticum TaxID=2795018 RepID=A0A7D5XJI9_FERL1|nr:MAG: CMP/dCMP deaminase zinc-binding [Candidatus Fermentimicrarchaeum limneticum]
MSRPSWDEYFMKICDVVAERSTCKRHNFGAVIVRDKRLLATGYNGAPSGLPHCLEIGCLRDELGIPSGTKHEICRGVHAEQNAIIQCALHGVSSKDATMYVNGIPCKICAKIIINSGIKRVVYGGDYADKEAFELFKQAGVQMDQLKTKKR